MPYRGEKRRLWELENQKTFTLKVNPKTEKEMHDFILSKKPVNGYLKGLVSEDMKRELTLQS